MRKLIKPLVFAIALLPLAWILFRVVNNDLGPDPAEELAKLTGIWAIRFLIVALAMTPLRLVFNAPEFVRNRRMLGLFALFYASCHFLVWIIFLLGMQWGRIAEELIKRPYITIGFAAYLILFALGVTSPKAMVRKLGKNWKRLHRLVYTAGVLAVIHLLWIVRTDVGEVVLYGGLVAVLLGYRLWHKIRLH
jgi:sulfoxide reductase heme-binding subunit YedZ